MESMIIYKPVKSRPKLFKLDPKTNTIQVQLIYVDSYTLIWAVVYFSVGLAFALSILVLNMLVSSCVRICTVTAPTASARKRSLATCSR